MTLNEIKLKRLQEAAKKKGGMKRVRRDPKTGAQIYVDTQEDLEGDETLDEGKKKHHTPKFVQHCVSAITEKPKSEQPDEPFAVCHAQRNKNKAKLDAKHAKGKHHTVKDYENALEKLRESVEQRAAENINPRAVVFMPNPPEEISIRSVRFSPEG